LKQYVVGIGDYRAKYKLNSIYRQEKLKKSGYLITTSFYCALSKKHHATLYFSAIRTFCKIYLTNTGENFSLPGGKNSSFFKMDG